MNYDEYVKQLDEMYDEIYCNESCGNRCEHWEKCKPNDPNEPVKFYFDRVKVGKEYGTIYPKILFAGLEGVHGKVVDYRISQIIEPSLTAFNNHYKGVRYVLSYLLSKFTDNTPPQNSSSDELNQEQYNEHLKHYCLTNLYKCAFGKPDKNSGLTHTVEMQNECYKIFLKEINLLRPDIVVIQVVSNRPKNLWKSMVKAYGNKEELLKSAERNTNTSVYRLMYDDGAPFYCIWTYHGNGAPFAKQRGGRFGNNNIEYIENELNPVLDEVVIQFLKDK